MLSKDEITRYLGEINDRLKIKNVYGEIVLAGGAALTLVFDAREATHDIDAIFTPANEFRDIIRDIATKYGLEQDWLNDGVKGFLTKELETDVYKKYSNLTIHSINAEGLLALKLTSARPVSKDLEDSLTLMKYLNIKDSEKLFDIIEKYTHESQRTAQSYFFTLEAFDKYMELQQQERLEDRMDIDTLIPPSQGMAELGYNSMPLINEAMQVDKKARDITHTDAITTRTPSVATAKPPEQEAQEPVTTTSATDKKKELYSLIKDTAENYTTEPERLTELFEFGSRLYDYSVKNNILIQHQNPNATYVQSFQAWKSMEDVDCSVKRGEKGLKIFVPVKATFLEIGEELVPLREATKAQAAAYKQGQIKGREKLLFKIGTVFDISQTTYPKERYPELYSMGYPSERHEDIIRGLTDFSHDKLNCPVTTADLQSISLRGDYSPDMNEIRLNALLEDTEKLSTLSHELGHAIVHNDPTTNKTTARKEFEADAMCIMIQSHCGIEVTDGRKRHLADNYKALLSELKGNPETEKDVLNQSQQIFSSVFDTFKRNIGPMQECIRRYIPEEPVQEQTQAQDIKLNL